MGLFFFQRSWPSFAGHFSNFIDPTVCLNTVCVNTDEIKTGIPRNSVSAGSADNIADYC